MFTPYIGLSQFAFARQQAETLQPRHRRPEPGAVADGTVASVARLAQVEVRFDPDCAAVAAASIGLLHASALECTGRRRDRARRRIRFLGQSFLTSPPAQAMNIQRPFSLISTSVYWPVTVSRSFLWFSLTIM
jgi:hypothetical protein